MVATILDVGSEVELFFLKEGKPHSDFALTEAVLAAANARLPKGDGEDLGKVVPEAWQFMGEVNTPVFKVGPDMWTTMKGFLADVRGILAEEAKARGLDAVFAGYVPCGILQQDLMTPKSSKDADRYQKMLAIPGFWDAMQQFSVASVQYHAGLDGGENARVLANTRMMAHQGLLLALGANSFNPDSQNLADRPHRWKGMPNTGIPDVPFRTLTEVHSFVEDQVIKGRALDASTMWWASRPHGRYPTVEGRVTCTQPSLTRTMVLAGLHTALVEMEASKDPTELVPWMTDAQAWYWAAAKDGIDARWETKGLTLRDVWDNLKPQVMPYAERVFAADLVDQVDAIFEEGTPAHEHRAIWAEHGHDRDTAWSKQVEHLQALAA